MLDLISSHYITSDQESGQMLCRMSTIQCTGSSYLPRSSNNGYLTLKCLFYGRFRVLFLLCDVNMMLREKGDYFHYPKSNDVEIPVEL